MIRTLIIDDEQHCIDRVNELLQPHSKNYEVVGTASSVEDGVISTYNLKPDLVFLDVQIADKTGFDYLQSLNTIDFNLIFTTAFEKYALEAIKFSALDYLLKPISQEAFNTSIKKFEDTKLLLEINKKLDTLLSNLNNTNVKKLCIPTLNGIDFVELNDILYLESDINYTNIILKNKDKILVSKTLKSYEELLSNSDFFRVHNSYLVNLNHIKKYTKGKGGYITLTNNENIDVSHRRKDMFLKIINQ